jgi:hypothetical protein
LIATPTLTAAAQARTAECRWSAQFEVLYYQMPDVVGDCLEEERLDPASGLIVQRTRGGVLRRDPDNEPSAPDLATFTDGKNRWVFRSDGGVERRPGPGDTPGRAVGR